MYNNNRGRGGGQTGGGQQSKATRKDGSYSYIAIYQYDNSYNSYYVNKMILHLVCALLVYLYLDWVLHIVVLYCLNWPKYV